MTHVYVLQHVHAAPNEEEDVKLIGVYVTEADAQAAVARLGQQPGFRDHPEGFHISRYELNKDHWTEGFIGWDEALDES
jgi:hypothetical protein